MQFSCNSEKRDEHFRYELDCITRFVKFLVPTLLTKSLIIVIKIAPAFLPSSVIPLLLDIVLLLSPVDKCALRARHE